MLFIFEFFLHPLILKTQEAKSVNVVAEEIGEPVRFTPTSELRFG